ncbi:MAG: aminotransferase class I/II-fold pyridoxal phosphate-dependent enzyme [Ignavibacteriales bacterium]|nr:MAG: aminotransferase class I/II-fold pyridoxal phosphate-dependent enzyme [Ignavibacteriales bacterium]
MKPRIWLSSPHMGGNELKYIQNAFDTNWIAPLGPHVDGFEQDLASFSGVKYAAALSSGTAAIHLALIILGVGQGDEVICQSFTFSASANPISYQGASPVFLDSERDTWNMDPALLEEALKDGIKRGKKAKAIIFVHLYGMPAKINEIREIANRYEIPLIEDAAEALGSKYHRKHVGGFSDIGILSFNGNKLITTSGGGAFISNNEEYVKKARFLATQARDAAPHYQHSHIGFNYRMSNVCAGIGRGQMEVVADRVAQRRANFDFYVKTFDGIEGFYFLSEPEGSFSNRWLTTVIIDPAKTGGITREDIRLALEQENIESRPLWKPMHLQPVFSQAKQYANGVSESLFNDGLCLPSGSNLTSSDLSRISEVIFKRLKG